jgi:hypothetical protein
MSKADRNLLEIEAATIYVLTDSGQILRRSSPDHERGPDFASRVAIRAMSS